MHIMNSLDIVCLAKTCYTYMLYIYIHYDDVIFQRSCLVFPFGIYMCMAGWYMYTHLGFSLPYMNSKKYK